MDWLVNGATPLQSRRYRIPLQIPPGRFEVASGPPPDATSEAPTSVWHLRWHEALRCMMICEKRGSTWIERPLSVRTFSHRYSREDGQAEIELELPELELGSVPVQLELAAIAHSFRSSARRDRGATVRSPITGTVVWVGDLQDGADISSGEVLVIIEAMKMENKICAPTGGTLSGFAAKVGDKVTSGQTICRVAGSRSSQSSQATP